MQNQIVSFTAPNPYQSDLAKIQEQRQLAQLLQQQSMQAPERFSYKGIEARVSPLTGLAKALQGFSAAKMQSDARKEEQALGERYRADQASDMQTLVEALKPREAQQAYPASEESFGVIPPVGVAKPAKAANVLDPSIFGADVLKTPEMRNFAFQQYLAQQMPKQPKWEKAEIPQSDGTVRTGYVDVNASNPLATFIGGGVKPAGVHFANVGSAIVPINQATGQPLQNVSPLQINTSPDAQAQLAQQRELADRAFNNLSAAQQLQARQEAQRLKISLAEYNLRKYQAENPALHIVQSGEGYAGVNPRTGMAQPVMVQGAAGSTTPPKQLSAPAKPAPEAYSTKAEALINATDAINQYQKELQGFSNIQALRPDQRARVGNAYQNSLLQLKEIYRLGVLNGPDKAILEQIITNPLDLSSATISTPAMIKQLESMRGILARQNQTLSTVYKQPTLQLPTISETTTSGSATPTSTSGVKFLGFE